MSGIYGTREVAPPAAARSKSSPGDSVSLNGNASDEKPNGFVDAKKIPYKLSGVVIERTRTRSGNSEHSYDDGISGKDHEEKDLDASDKTQDGQLERDTLERNYNGLMQQLAAVLVEKETLAYQVQLLGQAYGELKHQLTALAAGREDCEPSRLDCLRQERHRLADYIVALSSAHSRDSNASPSSPITFRTQSELWRNKFLASSLIVDELSNQRLFLLRQFEEAQHVLSGVLDEKETTRKELFDIFLYLQEIKETLDAADQGKYRGLVASHSFADLTAACQEISQGLHKRLLNTTRNPAKGLFPGDASEDSQIVVPSDIEREAKKIVSIDVKAFAASNPCEDFQRLVNERARASGLPPPKMHNIVVNCCRRCEGQILTL